MIGPCTFSFRFQHVAAGGFIEMTVRLTSDVDGTVIMEKTEKIFPGSDLEVGPFQATVQFERATISCPLNLYIRNLEVGPVNDYRGDTLELLSPFDDSLDGRQFLP